jgi:F-type H+-transporting ATPase subunit delta
VGRRYAGALYDSLGAEDPGQILSDLATASGWLKAVPELRISIENPGIPFARKAELIRELGREAGLRDLSTRFVLLAVTNKRVRQLGEMVEAFRVLHYEKRGIQRARVVSARPLDEAGKAGLQAKLAQILGRSVELESSVSETLLGGIQLHLGSTVYDGSVAGALKSLHQTLVKG